MKKQVLTDSTKATMKRVGILLIIFIVIVGGVYAINLALRGSGKHERALAEAIVASLKQDAVKASIEASQQSQVSSFSASAEVGMSNGDMYRGEAMVEINNGDDTTKIPVNAVGSVADSELYLKATNTQKIVDLIGTQVGDTKPMLDSIARKIDNKWLHIPQQQDAATDCTSELFSAIGSSKSAQKEMTDSYVANRFIAVEDVQQTNGKTVYTVVTDEDELKGFVESIKTKDFFKKIDSCGASYDPLGAQATSQQQTQAPTAQQPAQAPVPLQITVSEKGLISALAMRQQAQQGITSLEATLRYELDEAIVLPKKNVIEYSAISGEVQQVVGAFSQQQQAAAQQVQPQMMQQ